MTNHLWSTRSNARRAAQAACRKALGPDYQAAEGPDYGIHPVSPTDDEIIAGQFRDRYKIELRGPARSAETAVIAMQTIALRTVGHKMPIYIVPNTLSDGSQVFDVLFGDVRLHAVSHDDAVALADKIISAIDTHTTDRAVVQW